MSASGSNYIVRALALGVGAFALSGFYDRASNYWWKGAAKINSQRVTVDALTTDMIHHTGDWDGFPLFTAIRQSMFNHSNLLPVKTAWVHAKMMLNAVMESWLPLTLSAILFSYLLGSGPAKLAEWVGKGLAYLTGGIFMAGGAIAQGLARLGGAAVTGTGSMVTHMGGLNYKSLGALAGGVGILLVFARLLKRGLTGETRNGFMDPLHGMNRGDQNVKVEDVNLFAPAGPGH